MPSSDGEATPGAEPSGFTSQHTVDFPRVLRSLRSSIVLTTYQSGRVIVVREDDGRLNTHFRAFESPMGIAVDGPRLVLGTKRQIWQYRNVPAVAGRLDPPGKHDACFLPLRCHYTGDVRVHEVAAAAGGAVIVNTLFSCLATIDDAHSFVPLWRPPFVTALAPEDRCHLNGIAVLDDAVRFVTALGTTDSAGGWRAGKATGGVVLDYPSGDVVLDGLCMPHSPRWHDGRLWLLESGKGSLAVADLDAGTVETVATMPGFTRGLAFAGNLAFVGLSQVRERLFDGVPVTALDERTCGIWVIDTRTGDTVAFLRFDGIVREVFDVQLLRGVRFPEIEEPSSDLATSSYVLPDDALADVPAALRST